MVAALSLRYLSTRLYFIFLICIVPIEENVKFYSLKWSGFRFHRGLLFTLLFIVLEITFKYHFTHWTDIVANRSGHDAAIFAWISVSPLFLHIFLFLYLISLIRCHEETPEKVPVQFYFIHYAYNIERGIVAGQFGFWQMSMVDTAILIVLSLVLLVRLCED